VHELHEVYDLVRSMEVGSRCMLVIPLGAASGASPTSQVYRRASDRRCPRVWLIEAPSSQCSTRPLTGLSSHSGNGRGRTPNSFSDHAAYVEWKRDREKIHITPGSVAITSGVWPDAVTSIEPVYYGVGSSVLALLTTYHQHGEQQHPIASGSKS